MKAPYISEYHSSYLRAMARCKKLSVEHDDIFHVVLIDFGEWEVTNATDHDESVIEYDAGYLVNPAQVQDSGKDQPS